jgi:mannose-6-phosphate isomerase-like protein (cupin superfamily)
MKYTRQDAKSFTKHGVKMFEYFGKSECPDADLLYLEVDGGHYQEFLDRKSSFIYYVLEGEGTFFLDGKEIPVKATDAIHAPKNTKIYYLGHMKLLLCVAPAWEEANEEHIRFIEP